MSRLCLFSLSPVFKSLKECPLNSQANNPQRYHMKKFSFQRRTRGKPRLWTIPSFPTGPTEPLFICSFGTVSLKSCFLPWAYYTFFLPCLSIPKGGCLLECIMAERDLCLAAQPHTWWEVVRGTQCPDGPVRLTAHLGLLCVVLLSPCWNARGYTQNLVPL